MDSKRAQGVRTKLVLQRISHIGDVKKIRRGKRSRTTPGTFRETRTHTRANVKTASVSRNLNFARVLWPLYRMGTFFVRVGTFVRVRMYVRKPNFRGSILKSNLISWDRGGLS